jgi:hypothetical protein
MGLRGCSPKYGIVNTYALGLEYGSSWTPILASDSDSTMRNECCVQGISEVEFVRQVLEKHRQDMGRLANLIPWLS